MIEKKGKKYVLFTRDGKRRLSKPGSLAQIKKRERQVDYFKTHKKK